MLCELSKQIEIDQLNVNSKKEKKLRNKNKKPSASFNQITYSRIYLLI
jgi:hypothetical protein